MATAKTFDLIRARRRRLDLGRYTLHASTKGGSSSTLTQGLLEGYGNSSDVESPNEMLSFGRENYFTSDMNAKDLAEERSRFVDVLDGTVAIHYMDFAPGRPSTATRGVGRSSIEGGK